ncbi:MAG: hypothetical protein CVV42_19010 [Candidatus Riflebacteria bacterium HGW-Riflebacteria-2]|jgi:formylglycine-generating enzyme required for sulfatase activity|nr:MAG: hypothetical protein CVV42_19010 [Candidatus Riflebacteria bacterium HGW-Riflebacteria-2]
MFDLKSKFFVLLLVSLLSLTITGCTIFGDDDDDDAAVIGNATITRIPEMVTVPAGTFKMGWDNLAALPKSATDAGMTTNSVAANYADAASYSPGVTGPVRLVTITKDYKIGKYEITNAQFCDMLNYALRKGYLTGNLAGNETVKNVEGNQQELLNLDADYEGRKCEISYTGYGFVVGAGLDNRPVVYVTWYGAAFYCNMLSEMQGLTKLYNLTDWSCTFDGTARFYGSPGYRIPTEAEWEYAARYDDDNLRYDRRMVAWEPKGYDYAVKSGYGTIASYFDGKANYSSGIGTQDVGCCAAGVSPLGIYNLAGNASEWAQDFYSSYTYFAKPDGTGGYKSADYDPAKGELNPINDESGVYRQRRGGSWLVYGNNSPISIYHTNTNWAYTNYCDLGFRIVQIQ